MDTDIEQDENRAYDLRLADHRDGKHEPPLAECPLCGRGARPRRGHAVKFTVGERVAILSANGTRKVVARGTVRSTGQFYPDHYRVERPNGRIVWVPTKLLRKAT